jgi:alpha 1,6-mannosyltransferase
VDRFVYFRARETSPALDFATPNQPALLTARRPGSMLTIRKLAILVGAIFLLVLLILKSPPSSPSIVRKRPQGDSAALSSKLDSWKTKKTKDEIERILEQANRPAKSAHEFASLREHLEYLFPYQGPSATKFPAYIWQTWKFTPAMGEFDERFRTTEASWTEQHPDYVHEVRVGRVARLMSR